MCRAFSRNGTPPFSTAPRVPQAARLAVGVRHDAATEVWTYPYGPRDEQDRSARDRPTTPVRAARFRRGRAAR